MRGLGRRSARTDQCLATTHPQGYIISSISYLFFFLLPNSSGRWVRHTTYTPSARAPSHRRLRTERARPQPLRRPPASMFKWTCSSAARQLGAATTPHSKMCVFTALTMPRPGPAPPFPGLAPSPPAPGQRARYLTRLHPGTYTVYARLVARHADLRPVGGSGNTCNGQAPVRWL